MKSIFKLMFVFALLGITLSSMYSVNTDLNLRCMVQMKNYNGHGAYIVVSLLNENKEYLKTLQVMGDDSEWYNEIEEWWSFFGKEKQQIDGITGATIAGGDRRVIAFTMPSENPDYFIRFETAVEEQQYYPTEIDIKISNLELSEKYRGDGFIRYITFIAQ